MNENRELHGTIKQKREEIAGAEKRGSRWVIPESYVEERYVQKPSNRVFNTTGICAPAIHYMVDLTQRLYEVRKKL